MKIVAFILTLLISSVSLSAGTSSSTSSDAESSDQIKILYEKAEKYIEDKNYKKSLKVLKSLTKREDLSGFRADIYNLLGFSYRKLPQPDLDKSFAAYMMAIELDPDHVGAHEYLGELYIMMGNINKAKEMLFKIETLAGIGSKEYLDLNEIISQKIN